MRALAICLTLLFLCGCQTRREADLKARQAFVAGQEQALARQRAPAGPAVTVQGLVTNPSVPWTEGMTAAQAIVAANYTGFMNPSVVRVFRAGRVVLECRGVDLLRGKDTALQPGDVVQLTP